MATEYTDSGNDDGSIMGRDGGKLGFYGLSTAITKPTLTGTVTATVSSVSGVYGFGSEADITKVYNAINLIMQKLIAIGLMSAS